MTQTYTTRRSLVERVRNSDDSQSWDELINIYRKYIYVIIRSMNIGHQETEEILQNVLVQLWKSLPGFSYQDEQSKFRHWVSKVTRNQVYTYTRARTAHLKRSKRIQDEPVFRNNAAIAADVDEAAEREWELFITNTAMDTIKTKFSNNAIRAFKYYSKGMKVGEISHELSVKEDSVYKYIQRVKVALVEEIKYLKSELDI